MSLLDEINTELKKIDTDISFKKFFFYGGLLPTIIFFPILYLLNPVTQEVVTNIPIVVMGIMAFTAAFLPVSLFTLMGFKVYIVVSPKVSNGVTEKTYVFLSKNKNVQKFLDLFVLKIENKLNPYWNKQSDEITQNTERLDGHEYRITKLENIVKKQEKRITNLEENDQRKDRIIGIKNQEIFRLTWKNMKLETRIKEVEKKLDQKESKEKEEEQVFSEKIHAKNEEDK